MQSQAYIASQKEYYVDLMARILKQKRALIPHAMPIVREQGPELTDSQRQQAATRIKRLFAAYSDDEDDAFVKQRRRPNGLADGPITEGTSPR